MPSRSTEISKTLSYWLRHNPTDGGLTLDEEGWTPVEAVLAALARRSLAPVTEAELAAVVAGSDKQRFTLRDGLIRANQGHSTPLLLTFTEVEPPPLLWHGTTAERWQRIQTSGGLDKMQRHHVHLSATEAAARQVAGRHRRERPLLLRVDAAAMRAAGHRFLCSDNGVYLVDSVPLVFITAE